MTENQKLREVFEARMTDNGKWPRAVEQGRNGCYLLAQTENAWAEWQACAEALALPTADHLPDAGKMIETAAPVGEREAFEAEMRCEDVWGHRSLKKRPDGRYQNWQVDLMWDVWQARSILTMRPVQVPMTCHCHTCRPITMGDMRMVLCPKCGNKRCPHANDHRNDCTGSNEPGQPGSAYPAPHGITAKAKKE